MQAFRSIQVRDCQGTLWAFYRRYEGCALASFEGDLAALGIKALPGSLCTETKALRRQTPDPQLDFVVVPLSPENIASLKERLAKPGVLGREGAVIHTQIEAAGEAVLIACDNFHDECTVVAKGVPEDFLRDLRASGVLRGYSDV